MKRIKCAKCGGNAERVAITSCSSKSDTVLVSWWCRECGNRFVTKEKARSLE